MVYCNECGINNKDTSAFCGNCGANLQNTQEEQPAKGFQQSSQGYQKTLQEYQQPTQGYQRLGEFQQAPQSYQPGYHQGYPAGKLPPRTGWFTLVIVFNWIGIIILGLVGLVWLVLFYPIGIIIFVFVGLFVWLVRELAKYNNTARIIQLILSGLGVLEGRSLKLDALIGAVIGALTIYALAFHKPTVALFATTHQFQPGRPIQRY
ncbi:MAG: hypothetical protein ACXAD7_21290 [Candidatus Kariarchaeaceae archaeon]|jgi:hypothetical protein